MPCCSASTDDDDYRNIYRKKMRFIFDYKTQDGIKVKIFKMLIQNFLVGVNQIDHKESEN